MWRLVLILNAKLMFDIGRVWVNASLYFLDVTFLLNFSLSAVLIKCSNTFEKMISELAIMNI